MKILPIEISQVDVVVEFAQRSGAFTKAHPQESFDPQYVTRLWKTLMKNEMAGGYGAYEREILVGIIAWTQIEGWYNENPLFDVILWSVDPHYKTYTAGGRLLQQVMTLAKVRNIPVHLTVGPCTPLAVTWSLAQLGFHAQTIEYEWRP